MNETSGRSAVVIEGLEKTYPARGGAAEKRALKGVSLAVPAGSIFGLLGPNGAGKSTLINILAGLVVKTAGRVRIWGFDQDHNPRMSRASIGVVPQELNIDPFLTPLQALDVQAGLYGVPRGERRSLELLEALGLGDKTKAYARALSGGMRRRLLVAKAMAHSPPVLVLDEPTAGVDIELRRQLWDYVGRLNAEGVTVILTTHYLEEAEEMCDRIAIINHGEIVAEAPTQDLLATIDRKSLVVTVAGAPEALDAAAAAWRSTAPDGVEVEMRAPDSLVARYPRRSVSAGALLASAQVAAASARVELRDVSTEEADLEDVFLALTSSRAPAGGAM